MQLEEVTIGKPINSIQPLLRPDLINFQVVEQRLHLIVGQLHATSSQVLFQLLQGKFILAVQCQHIVEVCLLQRIPLAQYLHGHQSGEFECEITLPLAVCLRLNGIQHEFLEGVNLVAIE